MVGRAGRFVTRVLIGLALLSGPASVKALADGGAMLVLCKNVHLLSVIARPGAAGMFGNLLAARARHFRSETATPGCDSGLVSLVMMDTGAMRRQWRI